MRFLADAGISPLTIAFLKQLVPDAVYVRTLGTTRASDSQIVERARIDSRIIFTFDLDFGDVLALGVYEEPSVIILRMSDERADAVNRRLSAVLKERSNELEDGALIVVEDTSYRVRRLPIKRG